MSISSRSMGGMRSESSLLYSESKNVGKITLYEELRLIERNQNDINVVWKGAHMTLFFMAFVFGSFCTSCFHLLMNMFDDKCIIFPKVRIHTSLSNIVREFFSIKMKPETEDVISSCDYVSTKWAENSACYLPTYVPLVSGLAGLVWTTMFFMCSSATSNVTGSQRHWRALPLIFVFSAAMAMLCTYTSSVTHNGLKELCFKMAEVTGSDPNSYSINVATLGYSEHRILGVYQATRLCIASAWLHTICWILSALLVVLRVLLAVDFTLVRVQAQLIGNLDDMLQKYEKQVDSISADFPDTPKSGVQEDDSEKELYAVANTTKTPKSQIHFKMSDNDVLENTTVSKNLSKESLVLTEKERLEHNKFIAKLVNKLVNNIGKPVSKRSTSRLSDSRRSSGAITPHKTTTKMQLNTNPDDHQELVDSAKAEKDAKEFMRKLHGQLAEEFKEFEQVVKSNLKLESLSAEADSSVRLHNSSENESKVTEDSSRTHGRQTKRKTKDYKTDKKDGTKAETHKHIRLNVSDESVDARKLHKENKHHKSDEKELPKMSGKTVKKGNRVKKAEYSGSKRAPVKIEHEQDKSNKNTGNDEKTQEDIEKISEVITIENYTPLRISDDSNREDKTDSVKDKSQQTEEEKEDSPKKVDKTDDDSEIDIKDKGTQSQGPKDKPR